MRRAIGLLFTLGVMVSSTSITFGQGFVLPGVGPVNRSMGGAGTAAPLDATGALNWNPASISGLSQSRADIGVDVIYNRNRVNSGVGIGTPGEISGTTDSNVGVWALPAIGIVYKPDDSRFTYGLGISTIGGFVTNYAASSSNPLFMPPPTGFGHMYSRLGIVQFSPTVSYEITDRLSFGFAPTFNMADVQSTPFPFQGPNPPGVYPPATGNRNIWGLGAQAGLYYESDTGINLGASIKSPQWFERAEFNSVDEFGFGREVSTQFEYPMIISLGAAYDGLDNVVIAADVRYIDFDSTDLFGEPAQFQPASGAVRGLGWESVWMFIIGGQVELTDRLSFRMGYSYNQNPIPDRVAMFSVQAPGTFQNVINTGISYQLTRAIVGHLTYVHAFDSTIDGPLVAPPGAPVPPGTPLPGTRAAISQEIDALVFGVSVLF